MKEISDKNPCQQRSRDCAYSRAAKLQSTDDITQANRKINGHLRILFKWVAKPFHALSKPQGCGYMRGTEKSATYKLCIRNVIESTRNFASLVYPPKLLKIPLTLAAALPGSCAVSGGGRDLFLGGTKWLQPYVHERPGVASGQALCCWLLWSSWRHAQARPRQRLLLLPKCRLSALSRKMCLFTVNGSPLWMGL